MGRGVATLSAIPDRFNAGETVKYTKSFADFPATGSWTAKLWLAGPSIVSGGIAGTPNGAAFDFVVSAAVSGVLLPGRYRWEERVTKAGETYVADEGTLVVDPNIESATTGSLQDPNEKLLASVEAAIDALITGKVSEYQVAGRVVRYHDLDMLRKWRGELKRTIAANRSPGKLLPVVRARMTLPQ